MSGTSNPTREAIAGPAQPAGAHGVEGADAPSPPEAHPSPCPPEASGRAVTLADVRQSAAPLRQIVMDWPGDAGDALVELNMAEARALVLAIEACEDAPRVREEAVKAAERQVMALRARTKKACTLLRLVVRHTVHEDAVGAVDRIEELLGCGE